MAQTQRTPEFWEVEGGSGYGELNGVKVVNGRNGLVVAVAIGDVPELDARANARLIAAAPDLLDALKYARRFLKEVDHDIAFVDAAIAKAEGSSNA